MEKVNLVATDVELQAELLKANGFEIDLSKSKPKVSQL